MKTIVKHKYLGIVIMAALTVIVLFVCFLNFGTPWDRAKAESTAWQMLSNQYILPFKVVKTVYVFEENKYLVTLKDTDSDTAKTVAVYADYKNEHGTFDKLIEVDGEYEWGRIVWNE